MQYDRKNPDLGMKFMIDSMVRVCAKKSTNKDFTKSTGIAPDEVETFYNCIDKYVASSQFAKDGIKIGE
jgi:uncharacterized Fe-S cluster-containing radical SAM superfamily protein